MEQAKFKELITRADALLKQNERTLLMLQSCNNRISSILKKLDRQLGKQ